MKRKLSDPDSKESQQQQQQPRKREKLADVVIPTIQESVMENDDLTGIIGSFLEPKDKTAYCQTARINLADGPFVHPSKVDMSFCTLMGCAAVRPDVGIYFCNTHRCSIFRGKYELSGKPVKVFDHHCRVLKTLVINFPDKTFAWGIYEHPQRGFKESSGDSMQHVWDTFTEFLFKESEMRRLWLENLSLCSALIRRFIKNRRKFQPGVQVDLTPSTTLFQLEYDQLGLIRRDEEDSN